MFVRTNAWVATTLGAVLSCTGEAHTSDIGTDRADATSGGPRDSGGDRGQEWGFDTFDPNDDAVTPESDGSGAANVVDSGDGGADQTDTPIDDNCEQISAFADRTLAPVDVLWVVDTSGSMTEEAALIEDGMARFAEFIAARELDWRVVLLAGRADPSSSWGIDVCLPPPVSGTASCPDSDSERYRHVRVDVGSVNALQATIESWNAFSDFLRDGSSVHIVVVTDDNSAVPRGLFMAEMRTRLPRGFRFHSIVSTLESTPPGCVVGVDPVCVENGCVGPHGSAVRQGSEYIDISDITGGVVASICEASWAPIFDQIADSVVQGAGLACEYRIPDTDYGEIVYDSVRVDAIAADGVTRTPLTRVDDADACDATLGWFYDNNDAPQAVRLCPGACGGIDGGVEIFFDCVKA